MRTLNLGILAHVDAGKTSLTERLLHHAGVTDELGSVDAGSTRTDTLALERRRGITIKSAVAAFDLHGTAVNLIDTPGHPDFIAEVERTLDVLDGAVLVVSSVEGVQAQTRVLWRALRRLRVPTLLFANKIDRVGARHEDLLREVAEKLDPAAIAMVAPALGSGPEPRSGPVPRSGERFATELVDLLTAHDDDLLSDYVSDEHSVTAERLRESLTAQTGASRVHPVYFGSAVTGDGIEALADGIGRLLPAAEGDPDAPVSGTVFKVERGPAGERLTYARLYSGTVRVRDRLLYGRDREDRVTALRVFDAGADRAAASAGPGRIVVMRGLEARIGDPIGRAGPSATEHFAPPTLETIVGPARGEGSAALHTALTDLAEQDPLIGMRRDRRSGQTRLSLYGEVQKEVIGSTLAEDYGIEVAFRESTVLCVERLVGRGEAAEFIGKAPNPFLATVGLRVEPAPVGAGIEFRLGVELGSMPSAFFVAVEETVRQSLGEGLRGWNVPDCAVTMTRSGYWARQSHAHGSFDKSMSSTAGDFRGLTPLVLMEALRAAGTVVCEPLHRFRIDLPVESLGPVLSALGSLRAVPEAPRVAGPVAVVEGTVPAVSVHALTRRLPGLTAGEGVVECAFERHEPVTGPVPTRPRTDDDPLDREAYLSTVLRRVGR